MRLKMTILAIIMICSAVGFSAVVAGCGDSEESVTETTLAGITETTKAAATGEPIRIGALLPRTGGLETWGDWIISGAELRLEEVDNQFAGRPLELIVRDDASFDTNMSLQSARELVEHDHVQFVLQNIVFGPFAAARPYLAENKILSFAPDNRGEVYPWEPDEDRWDISNCGTMTMGGYALGQFAYEELGMRTVTTLGQDYETGYQVIQSFADAFTKLGGTVVQQQWAPGDTTDFAPYLTNLKPADCFLVWFVGGGVNLVLKQFNDFGLYDKYQVLVGNPYNLEERLGELGDWAEGIYQATFYSPGLDTEINKQFVAAIEEKYGMQPNEMHVAPYEAVGLILSVLEKTGGDTSDPEKLREAAQGMTFEGPSGVFTIDETGFATKRTQYINKIVKKNGELQWELVKTYPDVEYPGAYQKP